jgi:CCR4-NOT transcription complex subunit 2
VFFVFTTKKKQALTHYKIKFVRFSINVSPFFIAGMAKQPTNEQTEFQMSNEDFPALPGTQSSDGQTTTNNIINSGLSGNNNIMDGADKVHTNAGGAAGMGIMDLHADTAGSGNDKQAMKRGVQTSPDGK